MKGQESIIMFFTSQLFVFALLPLSVLMFYAVGKKLRPLTLAVFSTVMYFICSPGGALLLLSLTVIMRPLAIAMAGEKKDKSGIRRPLPVLALVLAVMLNAVALIIFGYAEMATGFLNTFLSLIWSGLGSTFTVTKLIAPIGIGFYTLRNIAYSAAVFRGKVKPEHDILTYYNFMTFFSSVICGPVTDYNAIADSLRNPSVSVKNLSGGLCGFVFGLAKVVLIAGNLSPIADKIALLPETRLTFGLAWVGLFCRLFTVYFTLAGTLGMAVGIAEIFGITLPGSMLDPFSASSVTDFFKRYNATVTAFYHDNILALKGKTVENITHQGEEDFLRHVGRLQNLLLYAASVLLCGMWYGAEWKYLLLAVFFGVIITIENLPSVQRLRKLSYVKSESDASDIKRKLGIPALFVLKNVFEHFYTIAAFLIAITAVGAHSFNQFGYYLLALTGNGYISTVTGTFEYFGTEATVAYIIAFIIITPWLFRGVKLLLTVLKQKTGFDASVTLVPLIKGIIALLLSVLCAISI